MNNSFVKSQYLDLRGTPCPVNFIRCRLALEGLSNDECLQIDLDRGDPESMVVYGLRKEGHKVEVISKENTWLSLMVTCGGD